jgi:hypothetical protein
MHILIHSLASLQLVHMCPCVLVRTHVMHQCLWLFSESNVKLYTSWKGCFVIPVTGYLCLIIVGRMMIMMWQSLNFPLATWSRVLEKLTVTQLVNKFPAFRGTPKVHCCVHNSWPLVPILREMNPIHNFPPYLPKIRFFNIIFPYTLRSSK